MPDDIPDRPVAGPGEAPRPSADPSQHGTPVGADAPQTEPGPEEMVSRAELNKVVGQRQAAKDKIRQLTAEMEEVMDRLRGVPGEDELRAFRDWQARQKDSPVAFAQQGQDIEDIADRVQRPLKARIEDLCRHKDALERRLTDLLRDQELRAAAAHANAINPDQVVALLRDRVRMTETDDGRFLPRFLDADGQPVFIDGQPVTDTRTFVDLLLSMPENANLVRPTVTPGSGARQAGGVAINTESIPRTKAEFLSLPADQRLAVANRMTPRQRDAVLGRTAADGGGFL